ncbi:universal stress protein [Microbacterium fluvii]|uniref:Universal stress protein n=1 Tax=Microbacterium fluvii TaxID=415215 RepID=A0ABW2HAP6_9MICO|nr:universal stress protein [Microbacterium fluvii]MCU4671152.1 universal stress protein [Microbacterium fluvii]
MSENTIIVGMTSAPAARRAADWAVERARERGQRVELIGVVGGAVGSVGEARFVEQVTGSTQHALEAEAARHADSGVAVTARVEVGDPVRTLLEASKNAALLVIGSDYRGPGDGPARGAHGIRIAAGAECPVVVVPDVDLGARRGVVVGVDGSPVSAAAVAFAAAEADRLGEPLIAVSVWTPLEAPRHSGLVYPAEYLANMQTSTEETQAVALAGLATQYPDLEVVHRVERGYPSQVINEIAGDARLTVMGSRGHGAFLRFLLGSISQEVLTRLATVTAIVR